MFGQKHEMASKHNLLTQRFKVMFRASTNEKNLHIKMQKAIRTYVKERVKQQGHLNDELASLEELSRGGSIDTDTSARLKKLAEMAYERKREETRKRYGFIDSAHIKAGIE